MGVDLGRVRDFTAIAVVERSVWPGEFSAAYWAHRKVVKLALRHLERIPLGTAYPEVASRVAEITQSNALAGPIRLAVDNTGVGVAVTDLLRAARPKGTMMPVTITGGSAESSTKDGYCVPKRDLIVGLQVMLQSGGLQIAAGLADAGNLVKELMGIQVKVTPSGNEQYGAWREGTHDDLVFAVALACWAAKKAHPQRGERDEWLVNPQEADMERGFRRFMQG